MLPNVLWALSPSLDPPYTWALDKVVLPSLEVAMGTSDVFGGIHIDEGGALITESNSTHSVDRPQSNPPGYVKPVGIGLGKPLSVRISSMFPGDRERGRATLVTSAVRNPSDPGAGAPRSMHFFYPETNYAQLLQNLPEDPGSDVIYYTPGAVDDSLDISVRFSFDKFDRDRYEAWTSAAAKALNLPVFIAGGFGAGPGGAVAASVLIAAAERALKVVWRAVDRWTDGDNDWVAKWTLNLNGGGRERSKAGYVLFYQDGETGSEYVPIQIGEERTPEFVTRDRAYVVNTSDGTLRYADQPGERVLEGDPYILAFINGAPIQKLAKWQAASISATLMERFLNVAGSDETDLTEILEVYNDYVFAKEVKGYDLQLAEAKPGSAEAKALEAKRSGALKNIQDKAVKDSLKPPA